MSDEIISNFDKIVADNNIRMESVFVPHSLSRNAGSEAKLNWKVTIFKGDHVVIRDIDYSAGAARLPGWKPVWGYKRSRTIDEQVEYESIMAQAETGREHIPNKNIHSSRIIKGNEIKPELIDVMYSLIVDADAGNYSGFVDWAESMGCNSDSISDKKIYEACIETYLSLKNGFGYQLLYDIETLLQDY